MLLPRQAMVSSVALALASSLFGQSEQSVKGYVVTEDGQPIAGVSVQGSIWKRCCPYQQDKTTTNEKGEFFLQHGGTVIHFSKSNLQPRAFVVKTRTAHVRVVMSPVENQLTVHACVQPDSTQKLVGLGKYGLHFTVVTAGNQIRSGKDIDYVRYIVKPEKGDSVLSLWFGPYTVSAEPDDTWFVESVDFSQRNVVRDKSVVGTDSWGRASSGSSWRQTAYSGSGGAVYKDADRESAALFDNIIDSICWTDYATK